MPLLFEPYSDQAKVWPREGRHILAQFDARLRLSPEAHGTNQ